ncbi:histidine--tRNA ligase, cytoplasmic-like [Selaginella moellendorffii]|uniref:histidine--tRNA ligase, cytoplasmic-like n=1 Tax=Selaginella moellendorffii TaxID=88036 RepID=UPI000D1C3109|nr:histidine--tRNA ligase, cytoplasmic-like [Selaginella moellendorffii]|eukprot:XP_024526387.1 histidine--tRNA ligase, cytoplasmic-like [Selaginella moellendorffii]
MPRISILRSRVLGFPGRMAAAREPQLVQPPKGTRDFKPEQMMVRKRVFGIVSKVFEQHGAVSLDTPVFELRETLTGKYGEDSKLIYNLEDQGGQLLSLRYDLTVPFARYLASNKVTSMKRYQIGKVYRRDNPSRGRYREFYQCDFDIAGQFPAMIADAEVIKVVVELLDSLDVGDYQVKVNHRKLLDLVLASCGVPEDKFKSICSAIDKLDKSPWDKVRTEMVEEKGLSPEVADKVGEQVSKKGNATDMLAYLNAYLGESQNATEVLEGMETLFGFLEAGNCLHRVVFDLSLARGLDYYTGVIFEAVFTGSTQVGSIAAGGRYDNLVSMFGGKEVPVVGLSLGIERVLLILEEREKANKVARTKETQVLILYLGKNMHKQAFRLASELWAASLNVEFDAIATSKLKNKLDMAGKSFIPFVVVVGEDEEKKGVVQLKEIVVKKSQEEENKQKEEIPRNELAKTILSRLQK